ncbi:hypothetical protein Avbf_18098 [Armadillidium vulgare]|nr:hypothetical protein Avbf_18098 [Armadillidium vulgare]
MFVFCICFIRMWQTYMYTHSFIGRTSFAAKFGAGISNVCIQIWILSSKQHPRYIFYFIVRTIF